jgi:G3E family GTPase
MSRREFDAIAGELSRSVIRAKGYVALTERPGARHLYQQIGRRWTLVEDGSWGAGEPVTRIVTIALRSGVMQE